MLANMITAQFKQTKIGRIPQDWEIKKIQELIKDGISNGVFNDPQKVGKGYRLINVVNLYDGDVIDLKKLTLIDIEKSEFEKK